MENSLGQYAGLLNTMTSAEQAAIENIRKTALETSAENVRQLEQNAAFMARNATQLYENTDENKELILEHLSNKHAAVKKIDDVAIKTGKNLLYFTIFLDKSYFELLEGCLNSIAKNTPDINFDVLFMTDEKTKVKIEALPVISKFNVDFMVTPVVKNAVRASMKKLEIYDYEKIDDYQKILFLDVDSLCIKDLNIIFQKPLDIETLYVCSIPLNTASQLLNPAHGLMYLTEEDAKYLFDNTDILPFNAGQYLFMNSKRMKMHFDNARWLQETWCSQYYYEQSVMNYYFVFKEHAVPMFDDNGEYLITVTYNVRKTDQLQRVTSPTPLKTTPNGKIMSVSGATNSRHSNVVLIRRINNNLSTDLSDMEKLHNDSTVVIHFAAARPHGIDKKNFITDYIDAHQLHV